MVPIYIKKLTSLENEVASNIPSLRPFWVKLFGEKKLTLVWRNELY
jgi:hypothetical protein